MSDAPTNPVIEEIIAAAHKEVESLREVIQRSGDASHQLNTIRERIESGIAKSIELADAIVATNEQIGQLAIGVQSLQPEELFAEIKELRTVLEEKTLTAIADLSISIDEQKTQTAAISEQVHASLEQTKTELTQYMQDLNEKTLTLISKNGTMLKIAVTLSGLAVAAVVAFGVLGG